MKNLAYLPRKLEIVAGTTVAWKNDDPLDHSVTADDKSFDTGEIHGGGIATFTIAKPGKYTYHCDIHNYMTGVIEAK